MNNSKDIYTIFTDGASRGNPGLAGAGFVIYDNNKDIISQKSIFLGEKTNNQAEYEALIYALKEAINLKIKNIVVKSDSQLLVRQLTGIYKIKNKNIIPLAMEIFKLLDNFDSYSFIHIPREENKLADKLANKGIDERYLN